MKSIPRASTQKNVNHVVFKSIVSRLESGKREKLLVDAPCGSGEFAHYLRDIFPNLNVIGVDLFTEVSDKNFEFHKMSAHDFFKKQKPASVDIITCISGIMCFDGIPELMSTFFSALKPEGILVITNDNIMTIRDRLNFLFFGHFKRFKLLYAKAEGNWNIILPQALVAQLYKNGFQNLHVKYTSTYVEDLALLPIAAIIYPIFLIYLLLLKNQMSLKDRIELFPFRMLISRHYIVTAEKLTSV